MFRNVPAPAAGSTATTMPTVDVAPSASVPASVQVTSGAAAEHVQVPVGSTVET